MAFAISAQNHGVQKMSLVLINFNGFAKTIKNHWKYVTFRMGKLVRNKNVEIPLFLKQKRSIGTRNLKTCHWSLVISMVLQNHP